MDRLKLISHRGNLTGRNPNEENSLSYMEDAIALGFDVELDLRVIEGKLYTGHDYPQYPIYSEWIFKYSESLWIHCKNYEAFKYASRHTNLNYFWHENDKYTITSKGYIWAHVNSNIRDLDAILVLPERTMHMNNSEKVRKLTLDVRGICSDYIRSISNIIKLKGTEQDIPYVKPNSNNPLTNRSLGLYNNPIIKTTRLSHLSHLSNLSDMW